MDQPSDRAERCFHGGQFFEHIGAKFDDLARRHQVVNADVLDAWFPPAPAVTDALREHLDWALGTSPPTHCEGLVSAIAEARDIPPDCIVPGAGSSDLIFSALPAWLSPSSRVLILDPTYGEYAFVLEQRIGCKVDRLELKRDNNYDVNLDELRVRIAAGYDMLVLVNPNSPTGRHVPRRELESILGLVSPQTRIWVDETYVDYVDSSESLESFACGAPNVVVCKSMSKAYGLSGTRVAYLCTAPALAQDLRKNMRPWAVGLPGQIAGVKALESRAYYEQRWTETGRLREQLAHGLDQLGIDVVEGVANFLLCHLPPSSPRTAELLRRCRQQGVFLRDVANMGNDLGKVAFRLAVKNADDNRRVLAAIGEAVD